MSRLTPLQIVTGKLLSALSFIGLMMVVPLPSIAICFLLGGVSPGEFCLAALLQMCGRGGPKASKTAGSAKSALALMDSRGRQFSSEEFARFLGDYQDRNPLPLVFAVGPADGFSEAARSAAQHTISLGSVTLAHELARVVLLEQIYRAFTILAGHPYHSGH